MFNIYLGLRSVTCGISKGQNIVVPSVGLVHHRVFFKSSNTHFFGVAIKGKMS